MNTPVSGQANLFDYFQQHVDVATDQLDLDLCPDTALYLTTMLVERARADRPEPPEQTLAELHAVAAASPPTQQAATYRELGDRSLYLVGYFRESLCRRTVGHCPRRTGGGPWRGRRPWRPPLFRA